MALPAGIWVDWPFNEATFAIKNRLLGLSAKLVVLPDEEVYADDREDGEDEGLKDAHVEKTRYRGKYCLDKTLHATKLVERA